MNELSMCEYSKNKTCLSMKFSYLDVSTLFLYSLTKNIERVFLISFNLFSIFDIDLLFNWKIV